MSYYYYKNCSLCGGHVRWACSMSGFEICLCHSCGTGFAHPLPHPDESRSYYNGFIANLNKKSVSDSMPEAKSFFERFFDTNGLDRQLEFLDVGGGSGLFSKAFEEYGYGKSTYVDMDPQSCQFVKDKLNIESVLNTDVQRLSRTNLPKFDLIYSRHLIEHLTDPLVFISELLKMKAEGGKVVIQCPNGDSLEYLPYYWSNLKGRYRKIRKATGFSKLKILRIWLTGGMLHGIDPPRHLWAFSRKGLRIWAKRNGHEMKLFTANLGDRAFSPGYTPRKKFREKVADAFGRHFMARIHGGTI